MQTPHPVTTVPSSVSPRPERRELDPATPRYLVVFSSVHPRTEWIAEAIGAQLVAAGVVAELFDVVEDGAPALAGCAGVIVGMSLGATGDRLTAGWLHNNAVDLAALPSALFVTGSARRCKHELAASFEPGWRPALVRAFPHDPGWRHWWSPSSYGDSDRDDAAEFAEAFLLIASAPSARTAGR